MTNKIQNLPSMINLKADTLGGIILWRDMINVSSIRLQENLLTGHFRIIDKDNIRMAGMGGYKSMLRKYNLLVSDYKLDKKLVILLHGLGRTKLSFLKMQNALAVNGFATINFTYRSLVKSITDIAHEVSELYEVNSKYYDNISFVTHSLGGIIFRRALSINPRISFDRVVMIAPPNQGSVIAKSLLNKKLLKKLFGPAGQELKSADYINSICKVPAKGVMIIAGTRSLDLKNPTSWISTAYGILPKPNDGTVSLSETLMEIYDEFVEINDTHTTIMDNHDVIRETIRFLKK